MNKFEKYFNVDEDEWHKYVIGEYHFSGIGCTNTHLEADEHSGP